MAEYKNDEPCEYIYDVIAVTKIVDGDTMDCVFDLGFDVRFESRVRLLGIDTPESRTRDLNEKVYGLISKNISRNGCIGQSCQIGMILKFKSDAQRRIVEESSAEFWVRSG